MESSRALPKHFYADPAIVVERKELSEMGCTACKKHARLLGRVVCTEERVTNYKRVPFIGVKCKYFELRD